MHSKYCAVSDWLQSPGLFFINNWRLPYLEDGSNVPSIRCCIWLETRLIDGIFTWKRGCWGNSEQKKRWRLFEDEIAELLTVTERKKCKITQEILLIAQWMLSTFWLVSRGKKSVYILKPCLGIGQRFEESLRGGKLVKNFRVFLVNNKTFIELGSLEEWCLSRRFLSTESVTSSVICISLHIILSLIVGNKRSPQPILGQRHSINFVGRFFPDVSAFFRCPCCTK